MGCGQAKSVTEMDDDEMSAFFMHLVTKERNPLAKQLNKHYQALVSECQYRAQGNFDEFMRMTSSRTDTVTVNQSVNDASRQGIGKTPLTLEGVNQIVELFLAHVMASLKERKWNGSFNYHMNHYGEQDNAAEEKRKLVREIEAGGRASNGNVTLINNEVVTNVELVKHQGYLDVVGVINYTSLDDEAEEFTCESQCRFLFFVADAIGG